MLKSNKIMKSKNKRRGNSEIYRIIDKIEPERIAKRIAKNQMQSVKYVV